MTVYFSDKLTFEHIEQTIVELSLQDVLLLMQHKALTKATRNPLQHPVHIIICMDSTIDDSEVIP